MDKKEERGKCLLSALGKGKSYGSPLWTASIGGKLELSYLRDLFVNCPPKSSSCLKIIKANSFNHKPSSCGHWHCVMEQSLTKRDAQKLQTCNNNN